MRAVLALLLLLPWRPALADLATRPDAASCRAAIAQAERGTLIPGRLLSAIAVVESGRRDAATGAVNPWPWTINVEGVGHVYDSKAQAVAAVEAFRAQGARSIDIGCMQVNLLAHPTAFASLEAGFDPETNARYAAGFLTQLYQQTGTWDRATAGYHSLTPGIGDDYARKVLAVWPLEQGRPPEPPAPRPAQAAAWPIPALPAPAISGRILMLSASASPTPGPAAGRGLDDYRAMPTRFASPIGSLRRF